MSHSTTDGLYSKNSLQTQVNDFTEPPLGLYINNDFIFNEFTCWSSKRSAVIRASDGFWQRDIASHTIHIVSF